VGLNFCGNLAAAVFVGNRGSGVIACKLQFSRISGLDLVAKQSTLTIGNGRNSRCGRAALFGFRLDFHTRETCLLQLAPDQGCIVLTVRRARQEARRIIWKNPCKGIRHVMRKYILLDAIPNIE
jgi:hypothetical protein